MVGGAHQRAALPAGQRDETLDILRGFACVSFVTAHFEAFTWLHFLFWERLGLFSGAELFVMISGFLIGIVHRRELESTGGALASTARLWKRAWQIYRAYIAVIVLVALLAQTRALDMTVVTTFTDHARNIVYPLYRPSGTSLLDALRGLLLLRYSPHQVQILGLYMVLLLVTPLVLLLLYRNAGWLVVALSLLAWLAFQMTGTVLTNCLFEQAFPILAWQVYYFLAMAAGYRRPEITAWLQARPLARYTLLGLAAFLALASLILTQATNNAAFPPSARLDLVSPATFANIHSHWFQKNPAQAGRVIAAASFITSAYLLLKHSTATVRRPVDRFIAPLGSASLYVFLVHVGLIIVVAQIPGLITDKVVFDWSRVWLNTAVLIILLITLRAMIQWRVGFGFIPR